MLKELEEEHWMPLLKPSWERMAAWAALVEQGAAIVRDGYC